MSQPSDLPAHDLSIPLEPAADAVPRQPFTIHRETVQPAWIDYNGHMNVAYYVLAFDHATDRFFDLVDLGVDYVNRSNHSAFVLETHVGYRQEVGEGDPLRFDLQLLDVDDKRVQFYFEMFHAGEGYLAATSELVALHVDLEARRSRAFPPPLRARLDAIMAAHADLPRPAGAGRTISLRSSR